LATLQVIKTVFDQNPPASEGLDTIPYHITLRCLGPVECTRIRELKSALADVARSMESFSLRRHEDGTFATCCLELAAFWLALPSKRTGMFSVDKLVLCGRDRCPRPSAGRREMDWLNGAFTELGVVLTVPAAALSYAVVVSMLLVCAVFGAWRMVSSAVDHTAFRSRCPWPTR